ncbi:hydroxymyristoyl-ACP dehydratase [Trinickia violacea]|uniref:Hydroxymyristoyl-ACP dehydratase n=1 Tax=Trinickia violacea TaxID=2571746 RepID=A0A4P8ILV5_9BURK|nr:hotdog family protein [Trinickia violacea]QCP48891.1 hydroxymyristoyl-ACP dehydratase [Trinickia violacea]
MSSTTPGSPTFDHTWIAAHIPHSGTMCLLDAVETWSDEAIRCVATSHLEPSNPLRSNGRLAAVCGIEYAAQAMAVHGAVLATQTQRPRAGFLASLRSVEMQVERLDILDGRLIVEAERISGDANNVLYSFTLRCGDRLVMTGRAAVILDASGLGSLGEAAKPNA